MKDNGTAPLPREGKRSATAPPDPEDIDKPSRGRFGSAYKLRILEEVDGCTEPGGGGCTINGSSASGGRKVPKN